ncbi:hypothetical protein D3875_01860 [Deinococcus cavernae]|uniref:Transposase n=2 Tax=Deinococcus cavernae TaxID=2320857 RepID=A0A418VGZ8_9DEIO|nr:hypothetical protein D3875_01860 [Deinococcus cavernae]
MPVAALVGTIKLSKLIERCTRLESEATPMKTRQFSEDQIVKLLQDAKKGEKSVEELCRDLGCSTASFYAWKKKYGDTSPDEARRLLGQNGLA